MTTAYNIGVVQHLARRGITTSPEEVATIRQLAKENPDALANWNPDAVKAILEHDADEPDITVTITRSIAEELCDQAEILIHEDQIDGVPEGVLYDTQNDRWTWELDEATRWALENIAQAER